MPLLQTAFLSKKTSSNDKLMIKELKRNQPKINFNREVYNNILPNVFIFLLVICAENPERIVSRVIPRSFSLIAVVVFNLLILATRPALRGQQ
jgi:hypothetical protein